MQKANTVSIDSYKQEAEAHKGTKKHLEETEAQIVSLQNEVQTLNRSL